MYRLAGELGTFAALHFSWDDPGMGRVSQQMLQIAGQYGLQASVQLDILAAGGFIQTLATLWHLRLAPRRRSI